MTMNPGGLVAPLEAPHRKHDERLALLLLEDSLLDAELITERLEHAGLRADVERVGSAESFAEALARRSFDLILSDYNVPGFDGLTALQVARRLAPACPFIVVSGSLGEERAVEVLKRGATDYVLKDRLERLVPSMERALRERRARRERQLAEEALRRSEERYQLATRATRDAIWDWDLATGRLEWTDAVHTLFGYPPGEVLPEASWKDGCIHSEERARVLRGLRQALEAGEARWEDEYRFRRADGSYAHVVDRAFVVHGPDGQPVRMVGAVQDVSERKATEAERQRLLEEAHARAEFEQQLIGIVSHDLRNPLQAIHLSATLLLKRESLEAWATKTAARILAAADRSGRLIGDLLDFTQARLKGTIPVSPRPENLHAILQQVVEESRMAHPERDVSLVLEGDGRGTWDAGRTAQVFSNLLANALKYSPDDGTPVRVEARGERDAVVVSVHNRGEPISPDVLPHIFEPLQRGNQVDRSVRSIGLGLYIVRQLVHAHGGSVLVRSSAEEGTCFTVRLPRHAPV
jgi:phosphoserine phosphatase RsbU/P